MMNPEDIREHVKERYASAARAVGKEAAGCCAPSCCGPSAEPLGGGKDPITRSLYADEETRGLPKDAVAASLGCGNPTMLAELRPGEVVLDLGSGGGIDVLLSARRVGPTGKAYGLDMTPEMLALARKNQREAGVTNVEFLAGHIEAIPLPDASVDVIVSNCVINLSGDKDAVLREAFRVLRPGGRFAVSDVVLTRPLPPLLGSLVGMWTGCVAGALVADDYVAKLRAAGFANARVETTRVYTRADAEGVLAGLGVRAEDLGLDLDALAGSVTSAFVRADKPR